MTIKYAILGFLSWRSLSGYDLKKLIIDSPSLYWSGNNNQIYRTLVELHEAGFVTNEVQPQEHLPARKVYTITEQGRADLRQWVLSAPELPQVRSPFLIQLAWADQLAPDELDGLIGQYEHQVEMQCRMLRERQRREQQRREVPANPVRTERETYLWAMIAENHVSAFERELAWLHELRAGLRARATGGTG
jgi:PadR family transcriptional regulator, regulatory protein AphA